MQVLSLDYMDGLCGLLLTLCRLVFMVDAENRTGPSAFFMSAWATRQRCQRMLGWPFFQRLMLMLW